MIVRRHAVADHDTPPDLLAHDPTTRLDAPRLAQVLAFGFAQGIPETTWNELFASARVPATTWDPSGFARDLFVTEYVASVSEIAIAGRGRYALSRAWIERVLTHPPADAATVDMRRAVLGELAASEDARADLGRLYEALRRVRSALESPPIQHRAHLRRRIEVLAAVRTAIDAAETSFEGATSALSRVAAWARGVKDGAAYRALVDLLTYDDSLATLDLHVRVGADGRVRGLSLVRVDENRTSALARTPLGRWIARVLLVLRGYRFDPEELLARAVDKTFEDLEPAVGALVQLSADVEPYLAALSLREQATAAGLAVCVPELVSDAPGADGTDGADASNGSRGSHGRVIEGLFNPLLLARERAVVPCDVATDRADAVVLLTGPNSGGKTRLLQALGLAQLLAQGGFFCPASRARLHVASGMYASLGQEPAADAPEGRLGTELLRVRSVFETVPIGGVVLLDELCSGTNPSEGEELFQLVVGLLAELHPQAYVSTHFLGLAAELERKRETPTLAFLQVELDAHDVPTYRFVPGVARTSLAYRTAQRLGVTRDDLLALLARTKSAGRAAAR